MYKIKLNKGKEKAKLKVLPNGEIFKRKIISDYKKKPAS